MPRQHQFIQVDRKGDVFCVRLCKPQFDETEIHGLMDELLGLLSEQNCRNMVLRLGPEPPQCLYSIFLAKLITLRRRLLESGGALKICEAKPAVLSVFDACHLKDYFDFEPDVATAMNAFSH